MTESVPKPRTTPGIFGREEALVDRLRTFLAHHAEQREAAARSHAEQTAAADKAHRRDTTHANDDLEQRRVNAEALLSDSLKSLDEAFATDEAELIAKRDNKRSIAEERFERRAEHIDRECKESVWLAETVLESGKPKPAQEFKALCKHIDAGLKQIAEAETFAAGLWQSKTGAPAEPIPATEPLGETKESFEEACEQAQAAVRRLDRLVLPGFFRKGLPFAVVPLLVGAAAAGVGFATQWASWQPAAAAAGGALLLLLLLLIPLYRAAVRSFREQLATFRETAATARATADATRDAGERARDDAIEALVQQCRTEIERARTTAREDSDKLKAEHQKLTQDLERTAAERLASRKAKHQADRDAAEQQAKQEQADARADHAARTTAADQARDDAHREADETLDHATRHLAESWTRQMRDLNAELERITDHAARTCPAWAQRLTGAWTFDPELPPATRVGAVELSPDALGAPLPEDPALRTQLPDSIALPIMLDVAGRGSLLVEADPSGRDAAIQLLQTALLRLLVSTPPGRAKLTIFDPVGRGRSFAGLMRLADFDESLVGLRIWTESRHMEQRLADLTEHIENVIQKYLRDDYATIDEYNRVAGEIAEPYRYLVIADFPANFSEDAAARLASIIDAGARCGVYVIMLADPSAKMPPGIDLRELHSRAVVLQGLPVDRFRLASKSLGSLPFTSDPAPSETQTIDLLRTVGEEAQDAGRVEVSYNVARPPEDKTWSRSCADELRIPIGRAGATKAQELRLGRGTSQHVLIAGKTGSGKSTLLHVLTTAAMLWHAPSEVEFYLVDFKKGVEFKPYASGELPHIRAVAIESDREFGLSILQRLDAELRRRGDLYREHGVQSLAQFRDRFEDEPMPRSILIIDEFQEFFTEDDRIAQDASLLLDRLVRQGRAFGIHVLLASQTLSGAYTLARSTVGQMAVRVAMKCSETDSYLILSEDNGAARLLTRPGEAIYNDANGLVEGNNPFQVAWLSDDERDEALRAVESLASRHQITFEQPVFFEGNAAADLDRNRALTKAVRERARPIAPLAWLGDPVSIKEPTGAVMRRRGGSNLLIVGQRSETAAAMVASSVLSLAAQHEHEGPKAARFLVVDGTPEDDPLAGRLRQAVTPLPHDVRAVSWRDAPEAVAEAHAEMQQREAANRTDGQPIYLALHGLHWLRALRRKDDDFSFSMDADKGPAPDVQLKELLIDGPRLGIFIIAWCDTVGSLTRALDRASIAEFGNRALMQMSANDSSMLIESTSAGRLGLHRAIFFDEERGAEEKFRPYGMPDPGFVTELADQLRA